MTVLLVGYILPTLAFSALLCGHVGEAWPPGMWWRAWRAATGPSWARGRLRARMVVRARVRPTGGRVRPRSARVPRPDTHTTGPSRRTVRRCGASQGSRGGFHVPATPGPPQGRTEIPIAKESQ